MSKTILGHLRNQRLFNNALGNYGPEINNRKVKVFKTEVVINETEEQILARYRSKHKKRKTRGNK